MSYCRKEGKDEIIFVTKEDMEQPTTAIIKDNDEDEEPGLILPNGDINWNCPCLGGMATGPCGMQFRDAFSCFHYSEAEPKGSDCYENFRKMQDCMQGYPELYPSKDNEDDEDVTVDMPSEVESESKDQVSEAAVVQDKEGSVSS